MFAPPAPTRLGAALLLAAMAARAEVPEVQVTGTRRVGWTQLAGMSKPFWGTQDGERWLFKSNAPVRSHFGLRRELAHGNVEGEWLSSRILQGAGLPAPDVEAVRIQGKRHAHARIQDLRARFPGAELAEGLDALPRDARVDMDAVRRMQAADLLIGNADRHVQNMWFVKDPATGVYRPIPLDHNVSHGTRRITGGRWSNFSAFEQGLTRTSAKTGMAVPSAASSLIMGRNDLYVAGLQRPAEAMRLLRQAREVQAAWPEERLRQLVDQLPDEAIGDADKAGRRAELKEHLVRRRNQLTQGVEAYMRRHPDYLRAQWHLEGLPEELRGRLPADLDGRWRFVEAMGPDGKFEPTKLRAALEASGLGGGEVERVLRSQGSLGKPGAGGGAVGKAQSLATATQLRQTWRSATPSFDYLEVRSTGGAQELRGVDGTRPAPPDTPTAKVAQHAAGKVALGEGERLRVARGQGSLAGYQVQHLGADGAVKAEARVHRVLGRSVRTGGSFHARREARREVRGPRVDPSTRVRPRLRVRGFR